MEHLRIAPHKSKDIVLDLGMPHRDSPSSINVRNALALTITSCAPSLRKLELYCWEVHVLKVYKRRPATCHDSVVVSIPIAHCCMSILGWKISSKLICHTTSRKNCSTGPMPYLYICMCLKVLLVRFVYTTCLTLHDVNHAGGIMSMQAA